MSADDDLVRRCLAGRPDAMRELVDRFQGDVYALCVRLLNHAHDAEDVTQEVFIRVFRSLGKWDPTRPLRPWVLGITVNRCRTWIGKRGRLPESVDYLHDVPGRPPDAPANELTAAIRDGVDELRDDYRAVFVLFHEQGRSYDEIAEAVGRPVGTVKTWLHRARVQVLALLRKRGLAPDEPPTPEAPPAAPAERSCPAPKPSTRI
ncbi:RNA polymerase sigma factor [Fimbriiglobus ruber]|uniref:RNA polymerase sigma-70 factor n=1 Tax=Fimbriiglobus ruber TaxID=1908690 RepID=A0A225DGA2_9BACT|nr:RNA polymerase sigma factor [Fimbriiglobus ruber]OWK38674.1 RNA polymerase sigma-70 factor [Fimbriiglobus ruber]